MPDQRRHRGPHPEDAELFAPPAIPHLRSAVADLSWLLTRDYATPSALKLVGDRYSLTERQRTAVMRSACSNEALRQRQERRIDSGDLSGRVLRIDGYNLLTTIEAALAGGVILAGRDGCFRDMASIHGTWRRVEETIPALHIAGQFIAELGAAQCAWYLDSPVSNSGRLRAHMLDVAQAEHWPWQVELVFDPDPVLAQSTDPIATADSVILDRCGPWINLARAVTEARVPTAWVVDLGA